MNGTLSRIAAATRLLAAMITTMAIAISVANAQTPRPLPHPDLTFEPFPYVSAIVQLPDGSTIIGGTFTSINGVPRLNLARLKPDGRLDPDWAIDSNNAVSDLVLSDNGDLFVAGLFTHFGGLPRNRLVKLTGQDLTTVDPQWNPGANGNTASLALSTNGSHLYVVGAFTSVGGLARHNLAKLSTSDIGQVDPDWNPAPNNQVFSLAIDATDAVFVGGMFSSIGGQSRNYLAKLSGAGTGSADPIWNPSPNDWVVRLQSDDLGAVYAAGRFTRIGGQWRNRLAKLSSGGNGSADFNWRADLAGGWAFGMATDTDGSLFVGGSFTQINGVTRIGAARLSGVDGSVDPTWQSSVDSGGADVVELALNGKLWLGGSFYHVSSEPRQGLALLNRNADLIFHDGFQSPPSAPERL